VGFSAGGLSDVLARLLAPKLTDHLGQSLVIENRPGASGSIATQRVAASPADGYTLLLTTAADTVTPALRANLPYNLERDFAPVSLIVIAPFVLLVHPSVPAHSVKELIAIARSHPGKLSYGSVGAGSTPHLAGEMLKMMAKVQIVNVPYKGGADNVVAAASGQVDMSFASIPSLLPLLEARKIRPVAVTSAKRASLLPSLPTIAESGFPGYDRSSWQGVLAPAGVPKDVVDRLNTAIHRVVDDRDVHQSLIKQGLEPQIGTPGEFASFIGRELAKNAQLIRSIAAKPE
jgi:tripartite-type tricarboxylate transporter receptor subunit TctC